MTQKTDEQTNDTASEVNTSNANTSDANTSETAPQPKLVDIVVKDEVMALNLIVSFLNLAQRRGAFSLDESAKLWECIKMFQKPV